MKKQFAPLCILAALAIFFTACGGNTQGSATAAAGSQPAQAAQQAGETPEPAIQVVATIFPPYDFVRAIAGETGAVHVTMLVPPGSESHSFEPTPQDMIAIEGCDMFLYAGGDSDAWVDRLLGSLNMENARVVALLDLVDVVEEEVVEGMQAGHDHDDDHDDHSHSEEENHDDHGHDEDHSHGEDEAELDEHVWTSPRNAIRIVNQLAAMMQEIDPENAENYRLNAESYTDELARLDAAFAGVVENAARTTLVFGDRFPFRYFADAYGLSYYAAFPGCSTETEASAATVAFLIDKVADEQIPVVFTIEFSNGKIADTICGETGAEKLQLHSCHNLTRDELAAGESYLSLMWRNVENLKEALQ